MSRFNLKRILFSGCLALGIGLFAASPVLADEAKQEAIKKDRASIQGTWRIVELVVNGNQADEEDIRKMRVVNELDGTWTLHSGDEMISKGTSEIDPTMTPKTIDFTATEGGGKGNHYQGIYKLGESKRQMCFSGPGEPRPADFVSTPGSQIILVKFELISKEK